jgi:hypothetical protein
MKELMFSRVYPAYHSKKGQPTHFVEKIYAALSDTKSEFKIPNIANEFWDFQTYYNCVFPKHHTIRAGQRWKEGEFFTPKVWTGEPYKSKKQIIYDFLKIEKVYAFRFDPGSNHFLIDDVIVGDCKVAEIFNNDGLDVLDALIWLKYPKSFNGQIICWTNVKY